MKSIPLTCLLALCFASAAYAGSSKAGDDAATTRASYDSCLKEAAGVVPAMQDCIDTEYAFQDKRLNKAYQARMATLGKDEQVSLRLVQRKWIADRDKQCAPDDAPGQGQRLETNDCSLEMTAKRAAELEAPSH
jgi:uncharacterized protein YecT (DUF1311 family)